MAKNQGHTTLHVRNIPIEANYEILANSFGTFGKVDAIRMDCDVSCQKWDAWITFSKSDEAQKAKNCIEETNICGQIVLGTLVASVPRNLDVYKPARFDPQVDQPKTGEYERSPLPPTWIVVKSKLEKCNFFLMSRYLQKRVGHIQSGNSSRFGMNAVLVHAKSRTQSIMLLSMKIEGNDMLKEITPHLGFSYGKGVVFNEDLHAFPEHEILEMCPPKVWKVKKAKNNMIILTFVDPEVPSHIIVENERLSVRVFKPKPMQCYNCYRFGHPSKYCKEIKVCSVCSSAEHGECSSLPKCVNCSKAHSSLDKSCQEYKVEEAALIKAASEHITVGYAKKSIKRNKTYARVAAVGQATSTSVVVKQKMQPAQPCKAGAPPPLGAIAPQPMGVPPPTLPLGTSPPSPSLLEAHHPSLSDGVSPSSSGKSDPSSGNKASFPIVLPSQEESLPDLMEIQTGKRGRPKSLSPPPEKSNLSKQRIDLRP